MNTSETARPAPQGNFLEVYNSVQGAGFFQRLLSEWRLAGNCLIAHEAISEADYRVHRGRFGRMALRWHMYGGYAIACWRAARKRHLRQSVRVVTTNPFFAPALVKWTGGARGWTVNLLYDLFPDALVQSGAIKSGSWLARRCAALTRFSLRECDATVFLGERLRRHAETMYGPARRAVVIPVGADGAPFRNCPPQSLAQGTAPTILYSGQLGRMHETQTLRACWRQGMSGEVLWSFHASGNQYAEFRKSCAEVANVVWGGPLHETTWQDAMKRAQVALVSIASGAERVVMPSKTYSALVAGQAILAICRRDSDLADLILKHDCGWVVEPGDVDGLRRAVSEIAGNPDELFAKRTNAYEAGHRCYDMTPIAEQWRRLFGDLTGKPAIAETGRPDCQAA